MLMANVIGQRIGNFQIVSKLGMGGMGEVYLGEHEKIHTKVAIKMLLPHISANTDHVERFFNEAIAVSKIQHAGIGKIFDVGFNETGRAYLVMEFLDGETLSSRIKRLGRVPFGMIGDIGKQMTSVLEAVHKAGITHRDLKPDNIFIIRDSELSADRPACFALILMAAVTCGSHPPATKPSRRSAASARRRADRAPPPRNTEPKWMLIIPPFATIRLVVHSHAPIASTPRTANRATIDASPA